MAARRSSDLAAAGLAALSAASALAFAQVFTGGGWVAPLLGAALLPHLVAWTGRRLRRSAALVAILSGLALVVYVTVVLDGWNPLSGAPEIDALRRHLSEGWDVVRDAVPPVAPNTGSVMLAAILVWLAAALADELAFSQRATVGAVAPALTVFVVATVLGTDERAPVVTAAFAVAALVFLMLQQRAVLEERRARFTGPRTLPGTRLLGLGAGLALGAVVVALVVAPLLPGAGGEPLVDYRSLGGDTGGAGTYALGQNPTVDVGEKLAQSERTELFRVRADHKAYWRLTALERYTSTDGIQRWELGPDTEAVPDVLDDDAGDGALVQEISIGPLEERFMPAAYEAVAVEGADPRVIESSDSLIIDRDTVRGASYTVASDIGKSRISEVTDAEATATAAPVPPELEQFLELPTDLPDRIVDDAFEIASGASNPFERARALRDHFRGGDYAYDPSFQATPGRVSEDQADAVVQFLDAKRGFCVQFATAYALMARAVGLPTRFAVGFTGGEAVGDEFVVTNHEAHAWPEVWLEGIGWTNMFDPTPPSGQPGGSDLGDEAATPPGSETPPTTTPVTPTTAAPPSVPSAPPPTIALDGPADGGSAATPGVSRWWWAVVAPLVVVALGAAAVVTVLVRKARRRRRRHGGPPVVSVGGAWHEALDRLRDAGSGPDPASTPLEVADAVALDRGDPVGAPLRKLADIYTASAYGPRPPTSEEAADAWAQVDALVATLDDGVELRERWRRRLDLSTLRR